jgi:hypothetical protein
MKTKAIAASLATLGIMTTFVAVPASSYGQSYYGSSHRQQQKNQWRNIGYAAAGVGLLGLLSHNNTVGLLGAAGAGYAAYRYEQDRKSQRNMQDRGYYDNRGYGQSGYGYGRSQYGNRRYRTRRSW